MHPVGPLDPKVYWIRRVAVIGVAVVVLVGLVWFVVAKARNSAASGPDPAADNAVVTTNSPQLTGVLATSSASAPVNSSSGPASSPSTSTAATSTAATSTASKSATSTANSTKHTAKTTVPSTTAPKTTARKPTESAAPKTTAPKTTAPNAPASTAVQPTKPPATTSQPPATTPKPTTSTPKPTSTAPSTNAQGQLICPDVSLSLTTTVGAPTYRVGSQPILGVTVTNTGSLACSRDVSGSKQVFTAYDAAGKRIWSTADCFPGSGTDVRYLQPGESLQYNIKWSGTTSQPGCTGDRVWVPAGTYTIVASIGSLKGSPASLRIE